MNAVILIGAVYGLVELVEHFAPMFFNPPNAAKGQPRTVGLVVVASFAMTFLVAASVWAHEQVVGGHPLDKVNVASKCVVAVFVAALAAGLDQGVKAVADVGTPRPQKPIAK